MGRIKNISGVSIFLILLALQAAMVITGCSRASEEERPVRNPTLANPVAARYLAQSLEAFRAGNPDLALSLSDSAEQRAGASSNQFLADLSFLRGQIETSLFHYDQAEAAYERVLALEPDYEGAWLNLGNGAFRQGNYRAAVTRYRHELEAHPDATVLVYLGRAYAELGRVDSARATYERALELDQDFAEAHVRLAELYDRNGKPAEALPHARRAQELEPGNINYRFELGSILLKNGRSEEAARFLSQVIAQDPGHQEAHYNLGQALNRLGETAEAQRHIAKAESLRTVDREVAEWEIRTRNQPEDPAVWATWAYALHLTGRDDEAARAYRVALHLDAGNADFHFGLANVYLAQGQGDAALREYEQVLRVDSTNVAALINTGIAYARSGDARAAQQAWRKALHFDPNNQAARSYLAQVQVGRQ